MSQPPSIPLEAVLIAIDNSRSTVAVEPASDLSVKNFEVKALALDKTIIAPHTAEASAPVGFADLHSNGILHWCTQPLGQWTGKRHRQLQ